MGNRSLSPTQKKQLLQDVFGENHNSAGKNFPVYSKWIDKLDKFNDVISVAELLPGINSLLASPGATALISNGSFVGVLFISRLPND